MSLLGDGVAQIAEGVPPREEVLCIEEHSQAQCAEDNEGQ
jgi:hypothetical protein